MKNNFISSVFRWLFIGLAITFGIGYAITLNENLVYNLLMNWTLIIVAELLVGLGLSIFINKMSDSTAKFLYLVYAALTGVTFSVIFLAFEITSILWVFVATAVIFGIFGLIGKNIKIDLSGFGTFLLISLLGMLVLALINAFVANAALDLTICFVTLLIFVGYIVFDINRIMRLSNSQLDEKYAIFWAFQLYLDIINIIIKLLRLFGKRK